MISAEVFFSTLALLIIVAAGFAVIARGLFAACVAFVTFGLLLSLAWMVLYAPDVAITEAAVGGGVTGALLLGACARLRNRSEGQIKKRTRILALLFSLCIVIGLSAVVICFPTPAPTLAPAAVEALPSTGLKNPVTAVLMSYRALDTMLEKVVLLLALIAVWSLASDRAWGGRPDFTYARQKGGPLFLLSSLIIPAGILFGVYLFWVGADEPGGAFAGGAIIAAMGILAFYAGSMRPPRVSGLRLRIALVLGIVVFLIVGFGGFFWSGDFLAYPEGRAKPVIVMIEVAMTISIAYTLAMLVGGSPEEKR